MFDPYAAYNGTPDSLATLSRLAPIDDSLAGRHAYGGRGETPAVPAKIREEEQ
jgi:hypothetical protein